MMPTPDNKIFCIGLSRTGTTALHYLFGHLGLRSVHYSTALFINSQFINPNIKFKPQIQRNVLQRIAFEEEVNWLKQKDVASVFAKGQVFSDNPIPLFYKMLDAKYPGSKFIYTYRGEKTWLKSMRWMLSTGRVLWNWGRVDDELLQATYGTHVYDEEKLLTAYRNHHADIKTYFQGREDDLLMINLDEEGIPAHVVCEFVGIPLRDEDWNKRVNMAREVKPWRYYLYKFRRWPLIDIGVKKVRRVLR